MFPAVHDLEMTALRQERLRCRAPLACFCSSLTRPFPHQLTSSCLGLVLVTFLAPIQASYCFPKGRSKNII